jgi:flagellar protein FlaG
MEISGVNQLSLAASATAHEPSPEMMAEKRELIQAVKAINESEAFGNESELTFVLDRTTKQAVIRVVDRETGEVIRQIPQEHVLRLAEDLRALG